MKQQETAVIYVRTSTKAQRDEKTIEAQIAWAREAVTRDGVKLLPYGPGKGWVKDDGVSGSLLEGREFKRLIDDIEAGTVKPDYLYVYSLSRLAREDRSSGSKAAPPGELMQRATALQWLLKAASACAWSVS